MNIIMFFANNSNGCTLVVRFLAYFLSLLKFEVCMINLSRGEKFENEDVSNHGKPVLKEFFFSKLLNIKHFINKERSFYNININLDDVDLSNPDEFNLLKERIDSISKMFDYVILDVDNVKGTLVSRLSKTYKNIVLVTCPNQNSETFVRNQAEKINKINPDAKINVLFNKVKTISVLHESSADMIRRYKHGHDYKVMKNTIRDSVYAQDFGKVYFDSKKGYRNIKIKDDLNKVSNEILIDILKVKLHG